MLQSQTSEGAQGSKFTTSDYKHWQYLWVCIPSVRVSEFVTVLEESTMRRVVCSFPNCLKHSHGTLEMGLFCCLCIWGGCFSKCIEQEDK